jgi:hypothetical protein
MKFMEICFQILKKQLRIRNSFFENKKYSDYEGDLD